MSEDKNDFAQSQVVQPGSSQPASAAKSPPIAEPSMQRLRLLHWTVASIPVMEGPGERYIHRETVLNLIEAVLAASAPPVQEMWQSIETAPKNRVPVLIVAERYDDHSRIVGEAYFDSDVKGGSWWWANETEDYYTSPLTDRFMPTHWMPIPEPPLVTR